MNAVHLTLAAVAEALSNKDYRLAGHAVRVPLAQTAMPLTRDACLATVAPAAWRREFPNSTIRNSTRHGRACPTAVRFRLSVIGSPFERGFAWRWFAVEQPVEGPAMHQVGADEAGEGERAGIARCAA